MQKKQKYLFFVFCLIIAVFSLAPLSFLTYSYSIPYSKQKNLYEAAQDLFVKNFFLLF